MTEEAFPFRTDQPFEAEPVDADVFNHFLERNNYLLCNILEAVEEMGDTHYVVGYEDVEGLMTHSFGAEGPTERDLNDHWCNAPASVFFAQRVMWTNEPEPAPTKDSWIVTIVIPDKTAVFFAKNLEDELWEPFPAQKAPWFAVSTASAMREAQKGVQMAGVVRDAKDQSKDLFKTPEQRPLPPVDGRGVVG